LTIVIASSSLLAQASSSEPADGVPQASLVPQVAERQITTDLEYLISKTVDPQKADYAVVTGVQIHNW
jgi:hypothetical protein